MCDEEVSEDTKVCPSCNTDLTLFSAEDAQSGDVASEDLKKELLSEGNGHVSELLKVADGEAVKTPQPVEVVSGDMVECPECGNAIPEDAVKCPHCGVEFEFEEMFECPMCGSVLEVTVAKCPSCGAEFEDAPAEPESVPAVEPTPEPEPAPAPEPAKPVSFAERLKQVKGDDGPEPEPAPAKPPEKKELSFAERMKAMREGTLPEAPADQKEAPPKAPEAAPPKAPEAPPPKAPETPQPKAPETAPQKQPSSGGLSISDRVKSLQQGTPAAGPPAKKPEPAPAEKDEKYKELPRYIGEVKKLLIVASELKIDVSASKAIINKAVTAGKSRDMETAIRLVKEGKLGLEKEIKTVYTSKLRTLESAIGLEKKAGKDVSTMNSALEEAKKSLEADDFRTASGALRALEDNMMKSSSSNLCLAEMEKVSSAIESADYLHLDVAEAKSLYAEAKNAAEQNDPQRSFQLIKQATDTINRILPTYIAGEMRKAKVTLREIKMMNVDINAPVHMLKDASDQVNQGDYCSALSHIRAFKEFVKKAAP